MAQPGQPAPAQRSLNMQDFNLKPALPGALQGVGIDQKLDQQIPLNLTFRDEAGRDVPLSSFFQPKKPVLLALVYYRCPMLCTQILNGRREQPEGRLLQPRPGFRSGQRQLRSQGHARNRGRQEADVPEAVRPAEYRQRLALPHR